MTTGQQHIGMPTFSSSLKRVTWTSLSELLDLSPDALLIVNQAGIIITANQQVSELFGYSHEELLGSPPEMLLPERLRVLHSTHRHHYFTTPLTRSMGTGLKLLGQRKDGSEFPVDISLHPVMLQDELLAIGAIRDMSEQPAARVVAEARAAELEAILEAMTDGVSICDTRGEILYTNAAYRSLLELEGDVYSSLLQLDTRFEWLAIRDLEGRPLSREHFPVLRVLRGEHLSGAYTIDLMCRTHRGRDIIVNVSGAPIRDTAGQVVGGIVAFRDMTERHRLEQQLQYSERKLRSLMEPNIFGMFVSDSAGRISEANDRFVQMVGYSKEEFLSGAVTRQSLTPPEYQEALEQATKMIRSTGAILPYEKEYICKDGSRIPILMAGAIIDQEREIGLAVILDISDRKAAERRKQEFLGMVSHELRTPLTSIIGYIDLALICSDLISRPLSPAAEELLGKMERGLKQAMRQVEVEARLVEELLEASRLDKHIII